ncbi:hypothetical protein GCM10007925_19340 [Sphingomonas astaxanthinifaciens DSM 22298]|uniref:Uncharacterized protein n=1 Tax=Sphingomonas astaxanthinifaciens DSM 22298 TaxID=1123267 RepID=A0ABQ5Z9Q6_9SPHN|nr:hypothetical protein GCM10007925_19340 [Sphingomonas astaxanthinifaciens DSM 22298]
MAQWTRVMLILALPMMVATECPARASVQVDDPKASMTLTGSSAALDAFLRSAQKQRHAWVVEKRWSKADGSQSVRLRWPDLPSLSDVASIVWLAQAARANGLAISNTQVVETQP